MTLPIGVLLASATFVLFSAEPTIRPTPVGAGEEMYFNYCAACHGRDGRGTGTVAPALKTQPADLSTLAARNNGKFPTDRVKGAIRGDLRIVAHGSKEMPIWGTVFRYLGGGSPGEVEVRIDSLTTYIKSLQQPPTE